MTEREVSSINDIFLISDGSNESADMEARDVSSAVQNDDFIAKSDQEESSQNKEVKDVLERKAILEDDNSISSNSDVDSGEKSDSKCIPFIITNKFLFISSGITLFFIVLTAILSGSVKSENRMHIVTRTLEIVDKRGGFVIWACHCISLVALPWLIHYLFQYQIDNQIMYYIYIFSAPVMMFFNMLGGFLPIKGSCYPLIFEVLIAMYLLFHLPFKSVYIIKTNGYFLGEITLMSLTFIYISSSLGASTLTYMLYGRYLRVDNSIIEYPKNPHYAIQYIKFIDGLSGLRLNGSFLACYSLFTFFSVGIGFLMSFRNSFFMAIPFLILAICTVIETHAVGILLFCQLIFHLMYMTCLQFSKSRNIVTGCCVCCFDSCNATLTTILLGDIIAFTMIVFPMLGIVLDGRRDKWPWVYFIFGSLIMMVGVIFHFLVAFDPDSMWKVIMAPCFFTAAVYLFGFGFKGYVPFIRSFTYEITYLSWSFALCFWAWANGHSPVLFKSYNALIAVSCLIIIDIYEGFGWMELIFTLVQIFFDTYMIVIVQRLDSKYIAWAVFSVAGVAVLGFLTGVVVVICGLIILLILSFCCKCVSESYSYSSALDYAREHNLKPGDTFECDGQKWRVE